MWALGVFNPGMTRCLAVLQSEVGVREACWEAAWSSRQETAVALAWVVAVGLERSGQFWGLCLGLREVDRFGGLHWE